MKTAIQYLLLTLSAAGALADAPSTHGMLLFGQKTVYASHLPMFHAPHDYQLLLELKLENAAGAQATQAYQQLQKQGDSLFTLVPQRMDLSEVISGARKSFAATLYQGHFERGGQPLGTVTVTVAKILESHKLDPRPNTSSDAAEDYLVFGAADEIFAAHLIQGKPNFDAIVKVAAEGPITLPSVLSVFKKTGSLLLPNAGDTLGVQLQPRAKVLEVIYLESEELSH